MPDKYSTLRPRLSIKELSISCGVPEHKLRYFERLGILEPPRMENEYRYFRASEIFYALNAQLLRSLGFPMTEVCRIMHEYGKEQFCQKLEQRLERIEEEIEALMAARRRIWGILDHQTEEPGEFRLRNRGALYGVYSTRNYQYDIENPSLEPLMQAMNQQLPESYMCYVIRPEVLTDPREPFWEEWGRFSTKPLEGPPELIEVLPPCLCLCGVIHYPMYTQRRREEFAPFLNYIEEHGYEICGKTTGEIYSLYREPEGMRHLSVNIPVRLKKT